MTYMDSIDFKELSGYQARSTSVPSPVIYGLLKRRCTRKLQPAVTKVVEIPRVGNEAVHTT